MIFTGGLLKRTANEKHYVLISRVAIILMTLFSLIITDVFLTTVSGAWIFIINASAGVGAVSDTSLVLVED